MAKRPVRPVPHKRPEPKQPKTPPYPGEHPHAPEHRHRHHRPIGPLTLLLLEEWIMALSQVVTDKLDSEDQKIADFGKKLDDFIATHQGNQAADDAALVARLDAQGQAIDAASAKLA